jgi:hypothetical protein
MTTVSDGHVAKRVLEEITEAKPELGARIATCKGKRMPFPFDQQRVLQVTLTDGQYLQQPFLPKGTHYGTVIAALVDGLKNWKVKS